MRISFFSFSICDCGYSVGHAVYPDSLVFVFDSLLQSSFHPIRFSSCGSRWRLTALVYKQHLCASHDGAHHPSHFCILGHTSCIYTENILQYACLIRCERYFARRSLPSRRPIYSGHTADLQDTRRLSSLGPCPWPACRRRRLWTRPPRACPSRASSSSAPEARYACKKGQTGSPPARTFWRRPWRLGRALTTCQGWMVCSHLSLACPCVALFSQTTHPL